MTPEPPLSQGLQEELIAYLDGELDAERGQRIERLIAEDERVRRELQRLEQSWQALDELPAAEIDPRLTQSTVAMATIAAREELSREQSQVPVRRGLFWLTIAGAFALSAWLGYQVTRAALPDPNQELLRDLTILEQLDEYREAGEIEFLRGLADERVFGEESADVP